MLRRVGVDLSVLGLPLLEGLLHRSRDEFVVGGVDVVESRCDEEGC